MAVGRFDTSHTVEVAEDGSQSAGDNWSRWILRGREGGDEALRQRFMTEVLLPIRDQVLDRGRVGKGDVVVDVGSGDGLIAFGALDRVGSTGHVIFSDVSTALLEHCRSLATELKLDDRCSFVERSADNLVGVRDASVDVVTTRSVLIYVNDKHRAFEEFYRVLRPHGRISIWEPINRLTYPAPANEWFGYDVSPVRELADRIKSSDLSRACEPDAMLNFDERDLFAHAEQVGFAELHLELTRVAARRSVPRSWESFYASSPNPLAPTVGELIESALSVEARKRFAAHLRPLVEGGTKVDRHAFAHLWGERPSSR